MKLKRALIRLIAPARNYHGGDKVLLFLSFLILFFGLISLASASAVVAYARFDDAYYFFNKQLVGVFLGLTAFYVLARIDYHVWRRFAFAFLLASVLLLLLVFVPGLGRVVNNSRSWIDIFGFSLQPAEIVKLSFLIYLAAWLEVRKRDLHQLEMGVGPFLAVIGLVGALIMLQPDFGTLFIIALTSLIVYFVGGGSYKHLILIFLTALIAVFVMVQFKPYQMDRFRCVIDPSYSPSDRCYQVRQSLIAVSTGGLLGRGLGESRQKFLYIPEVYNDSIFAVIAEEIGFIFSSLLILAYALLFWRGYLIAKQAPDDFGRNLAIGIVVWISLQSFINIGGIVALIPMTGVPLPLISSGGSSILASLAAIGLLYNISRQTKTR